MADLPVPLILPSGEAVAVDLDDHFPGDPLPKRIHRSDGMSFIYDADRHAYVKDTTHVLPVAVIYPNGERGKVELAWWWAGDRYPGWFWEDRTRYVFDKHRNAYVRDGNQERHRGIVTSLVGSIFLFSLPAIIAALASETTNRYGEGVHSLSRGLVVYAVVLLVATLPLHLVRLGRAEAHNRRYGQSVIG